MRRDFINRINDAILRGINESFDIEDMGHELSTEIESKQKVDKHSKIYKMFIGVMESLYPKMKSMNMDYQKIAKSLDKETKEILYIAYTSDDPETMEYVNEYRLGVFLEYVGYIIPMMDKFINHLLYPKWTRMPGASYNGVFVEPEVRDFILKELQTIKSRDDKMYGYYKCGDRTKLRKIANTIGFLPFLQNDKAECILNLNWIDVSKASNLGKIFKGLNFNGDISLWNVNNVTNMEELFKGCAFNGDISQWNVSNVTTAREMFTNSEFNGDISGWKFYNLEDASSMFYKSKFTGDLSDWEFPKVENMRYMFSKSKFNGDISRWRFPMAKDLSFMFYGCNSFKGDISDWEFPSVLDVSGMFKKSSFNGDISRWKFPVVYEMGQMFAESKFTGDISEWEMPGAYSMFAMFEKAKFNGDISGWDVSTV